MKRTQFAHLREDFPTILTSVRVEGNDAARPFAYADPRSLSQAWYDALYGAHKMPQERHPSRQSAHVSDESSRAAAPPPQAGGRDPGAFESEPAEHPALRASAVTARGTGGARDGTVPPK